MFKCNKCNELKSIECFSYRSKENKTRHKICKTCRSAYQKERWHSNKDGVRDKGRAASRNYNYRNRYNMPEDVVQRLMKDSNGNCEICKKQTKLFVDHCHGTEKYRGLLCRSCNLMLGYAKDNIETLIFGANYLKQKG